MTRRWGHLRLDRDHEERNDVRVDRVDDLLKHTKKQKNTKMISRRTF